MKNKKYLFIITIAYFALGLVNIHFALLGLICMGIPIYILFRYRKKTWCQKYCPRASLCTTVGKVKPYKHITTPKFLAKGSMKWIMLAYFSFNMIVMIFSTVMVATGKAAPFDHVRLLFVLKLPEIPQLFTLHISGWLLHLSYRFFSMMMTTTLLGLILALIYRPRTWCAICPISTVSNAYIKAGRK